MRSPYTDNREGCDRSHRHPPASSTGRRPRIRVGRTHAAPKASEVAKGRDGRNSRDEQQKAADPRLPARLSPNAASRFGLSEGNHSVLLFQSAESPANFTRWTELQRAKA